MQTDEVKQKKKLALSTKRKASEDISTDCRKRSALEPKSHLFQAFFEARESLRACLLENRHQVPQWPQSKLLFLPAVVSTATITGQQWTPLPRPNVKYLTRQPIYTGTLRDIIGELAKENSPEEEDPFAKFDELCANIDLTVHMSSPSKDEFPVINIPCSKEPPLSIHTSDTPIPIHMDEFSSPGSTNVGAICPVCGDLLVSKASLQQHMKACVDFILLD